MNLYELTSEYEKIINLLENCEEGEEMDLGKLLDAVVGKIEGKLENCGWAMKMLKAKSDFFKNEAKRFGEKAKAAEKHAESFKAYISKCLAGKAMQTKSFSFTHITSTETVIKDEDKVPEQYRSYKMSWSPDKTLIKKDLQSGAKLDFAELKTNLNLQIK